MNTCGWGEKSISRIDIVAKINVRDFNLPIRRRMVRVERVDPSRDGLRRRGNVQ